MPPVKLRFPELAGDVQIVVQSTRTAMVWLPATSIMDALPLLSKVRLYPPELWMVVLVSALKEMQPTVFGLETMSTTLLPGS